MTVNFTDLEDLALTVWGEARGEPVAGQMAVAHVILNRTRDVARRWRSDVSGVCTQPKQFSCWNSAPPTGAPLNDPVFSKIVQLCLKVISGAYQDPTNGANHYLNLSLAHPSWYDPTKVVAVIGGHTFLRL